MQYPNFTWTAVSGVASYKIQISDTSSFATIVRQSTSDIARYVPSAALAVTIEALIRGEWKLVLDSPCALLELYNLKRDPQETTDFAAKEKAVVRDLTAALRHNKSSAVVRCRGRRQQNKASSWD